jgi:putative addiction module component (TIGR02574 family)
MDAQVQSVFDAALGLPEAERVVLAERLLESVPSEADELSEGEFLMELERRSADFQQGTADAVPWSELKKEQ